MKILKGSKAGFVKLTPCVSYSFNYENRLILDLSFLKYWISIVF